jgi:hypothetical protein
MNMKKLSATKLSAKKKLSDLKRLVPEQDDADRLKIVQRLADEYDRDLVEPFTNNIEDRILLLNDLDRRQKPTAKHWVKLGGDIECILMELQAYFQPSEWKDLLDGLNDKQ